MDANKLIDDQFKILDPALQEALKTTPWKITVGEIASSNDLDPQKASGLEAETMFVMYCFEEPADFQKNLISELGIDALKAKILESKVTDLVFNPVLSKMEELKKSMPAGRSPDPAIEPIPTPPIDLSKQLEIEPPKPEPLITPSIDTAHTTPQIIPKTEITPEAPKVEYKGMPDPYREPIN
ncbi:MAG: hypothetical protein JWN89_581 [Parcubacteria group bacterium]|nr:hypothetical protein [Parcubacteria group bacterium]